jgi:hypothetical protein
MNISPIYLRNVPPPAETFDHPTFLSGVFYWLKPENYLELGVRDGRNFKEVSPFCKKMVGVDICPIPFDLEQNMTFHQMSTDEFFSKLDDTEKYDCVFIDADHSHEQSLKDFLNVKDRMVDDGFIFFHDTYPYAEYMMDKNLCNDVYKTALYIKQNFIDQFEILTLPFNPGLTILKKIDRNKQVVYKS